MIFPSVLRILSLVAHPVFPGPDLLESHMWNIVWGLVCVVGGASGQLALRGTNSSGALVAVGGVLILVGIFQMMKARSE